MSLRATAANVLRDGSLLAALAICLLAAALRIMPLRESLWLDELHTAWCALGPLDEVARRAAMGNQAPLFFWLEWLLTAIVGESEASLRLPSLIAGILLPLALFLFARRWKADTAGLVAAGLGAVDPLSVFYSTEARPYALVQLLAVAYMAVTAQLTERPSGRARLAWVLLAAVLFHLHYTSALLIAGAGIFLMSAPLIVRRQPTYPLASLVIDLSLVVLLCSLAVSNVRHIMAHRSNWAAFVQQLSLGDAIQWTPLPLWAWSVLITAAVISWRLSASNSMGPLRPIPILVLTWLLVPPTIAWILTTTDFARLLFPRYIAGAFPAAMLLAGLCVQALTTRWLKSSVGLATVAIGLWCGGIVHQMIHDGRVIADRNEDWRSAVAFLNERLAIDAHPVLVYSGLIEADELTTPHNPLLDEYCLCPVNSLYQLDAAPSDTFPLPLHKPGQLPPNADQLTLHRGGCWLVVRGNKELARSVAMQVSSGLQRSAFTSPLGHREFQYESFGKVQVVSIRIE